MQSLNSETPYGVGDATQLPSEILKTDLLSLIKNIKAINDLSQAQKKLLIAANIVIKSFNDERGSLQVTINNYGEAKTITITGFQTSKR